MQPETQMKPRRRFQFGISGLLVTVFGTAVGLSLLHVQNARYIDCILAAVSAWFTLGLLWQSRDLFFALRRNNMLPAERKWAWRFAIVWRLVIAVSFVGHYALFQLIGNGLLTLEKSGLYICQNKELLEIPFLLSFLVVLWSLCIVKQRKHGWYSRTITVLGGIVCTAWFFRCCMGAACVPFLVYISVLGIEMAEPLQYTQCVYGPQWIQKHYYLLFGSCAAVLLLILSIAFCISMVRRWQQAGKSRTIWIVSSFGCLALTSVFPIWVYAFELRRLSRAFAEGLWCHSGLAWTVAGLLCLGSASGVAWRVTRRAATPADGQAGNERPSGRVYYHEQTTVIGCLFVAMFLVLVKLFGESGIFMLGYCFSVPSDCVLMAVFLMAARIFWQRLRRPADLPSPVDFAVSPGCYALTWLYVLGALVIGASALAWLGFSVWTVPYWTSYW
jgi:hypothetical protein